MGSWLARKKHRDRRRAGACYHLAQFGYAFPIRECLALSGAASRSLFDFFFIVISVSVGLREAGTTPVLMGDVKTGSTRTDGQTMRTRAPAGGRAAQRTK